MGFVNGFSMVFGLIGTLFNLVTFPGVLFNQLVQDEFVEKYSDVSFSIEGGDEDTDFSDLSDEELVGALEEMSDEEAEEAQLVADYGEIEPYRNLFLVVLGPFVVSTVVAAVFFVPTVVVFQSGIPFLVLAWLGLSIGSHAFPNPGATEILWERSESAETPLRIFGFLVSGAGKLLNMLRFGWVDFFYALGLYYVIILAFGY